MGPIKKEPPCPQCGLAYVLRLPPRNRVQRALGLFSRHPFRCQLCFTYFRAFRFGTRMPKAQMDRRHFWRFAINCPVELRSSDVVGQGTVRNLSMGGCAIETDVPVQRGTILELGLRIWEDRPEVMVKSALVRSVRTSTLGVEFLYFQDQSQARLLWFIQGLILHEFPGQT